ncbi:MAG: CDP-diacylglycerol diphosphatase [Pseudomonadota bacterium]
MRRQDSFRKKASLVFALLCLALLWAWFPRPAFAGQPVDCSLAKGSQISLEASKRCILWNVVQSCLEPSSSSYCSACQRPLVGAPCAVGDECLRTDVWNQDEDFVAFKDHFRTCGCAKGFVHGLVIPRHPCTGVEDKRTMSDPHLVGAWAFAWKTAAEKIKNQDEILLVANPFSLRSQDQLHIHIVRPGTGIRQKLLSLMTGAAGARELAPNVRAVAARIRDVNQVWSEARKAATIGGFIEYGIAVIGDGKEYLVIAVDASRKGDMSPERALASYECPEKRPINQEPRK